LDFHCDFYRKKSIKTVTTL